MFVDVQPQYTLVVCGSVVTTIWRGEMTLPITARVGDVILRTAETSDDPISVLTIASFRAPIPTQEVRERIADCYRTLGPRLHAVAQVVEGSGFWAATARCVMVGLNLVGRGAYRRAVFGTQAEAIAWLDGRDGIENLAIALGELAA